MWKIIALCAIFIATLADGRRNEVHFMQERSSPSDLRRALFEEYDSKALPVLGPHERVPLSAALAPIFIRELDEVKEIIVLDAWIQMKWVDKHLTWNPSAYSGIETLNVPSSEVWKPDISTYTASPDVELIPRVQTNVILNYTGGVIWVPPITVSSRCPLNLNNFPKDIQRCEIILGSWTYGSLSIDLQLYTQTVELSNFKDNNPEWSLQEATVQRFDKHYPCCPNESYPSLSYNMTLKRKGSSTVAIADIVSTFAVLVAAVMFFLPPDSTQKMVLGALAEVLLGLVALYLGAVLPAPAAKFQASERIYGMMIIVAALIFFETIVVNISRVMGPCRPPRWLLAACRGFCQPFGVCFSGKYGEENEEKNSTPVREEWNVIAMALDRTLLVISVAALVFYRLL